MKTIWYTPQQDPNYDPKLLLSLTLDARDGQVRFDVAPLERDYVLMSIYREVKTGFGKIKVEKIGEKKTRSQCQPRPLVH